MIGTTKPVQEREGRQDQDPQPWRTDEDVRGWRRVGRAHLPGQPLGASILVDVTREEASWLERVGAAAALTPSGVLHALLEQAQQTGWRPAAPAAGEATRANGAP
jgi:hypothetical protein